MMKSGAYAQRASPARATRVLATRRSAEGDIAPLRTSSADSVPIRPTSSNSRYAARRSGRSAAARNSHATGSDASSRTDTSIRPGSAVPPHHIWNAPTVRSSAEGTARFQRPAPGRDLPSATWTRGRGTPADRRRVGQHAVFLVEQETGDALARFHRLICVPDAPPYGADGHGEPQTT